MQRVETHRLHRARRSPDVSGVARFAQHDSDISQEVGFGHAVEWRAFEILRFPLMHPMLNTAVKAARRAGNIIIRATRTLDIVAVREKAVKLGPVPGSASASEGKAAKTPKSLAEPPYQPERGRGEGS